MKWRECCKCLCRGGYDAFNEWKKPCEHWIRWNCTASEDGNPCHICEGPTITCTAYKQNSEHLEGCLEAVTQVFDDGTRWCPLVEAVGCEECYKRFEERNDEND